MAMLQTKNCIITGKPATIWTGHVKLKRCFVDGGHYEDVCVIAGFADEEICNEAKSDGGCYGDYKSEYEITVQGLGDPYIIQFDIGSNFKDFYACTEKAGVDQYFHSDFELRPSTMNFATYKYTGYWKSLEELKNAIMKTYPNAVIEVLTP